jgi:hypothetical protein
MNQLRNGQLNRSFSKEEIQMAKIHMKKMLTIPGHKGNANQNHTKIPPHPCYNSHHQKHRQQQMLARVWEKGTLVHCWWECNLVQPLWKTIWRLLKKTKHRSAI